MIASEKGGRGAERHLGRSAFVDREVERSMRRLLELGEVDATSHVSDVSGARIHYLAAGAGQPMVLLHGAGGGAANWYRLMGPLSRQFRVFSIDLPGFGLTDSISPRAPVGRQVADLIAELLRQLDVRPIHIAGTSFGGLVGARLAQLMPPETITLIDAAGLWTNASLGLRLACNRVMQRIPLKQSKAGVRWLFRNVLIRRRLAPDDEAALIDYIYWSSVRTDQRAMARAYALFAGLRGQREVLTAEELRSLAPKKLIIWGEQDRFLPASLTGRAAALAAGAQLRMIPSVGHSPNWESPDLVLKEILSFLK